MTDLAEILRSIDSRLAKLEAAIAQQPTMLTQKQWLTPKDVEKLSQQEGCIPIKAWTVADACNPASRSGCRIPEAVKQDNGKWLIPREVAYRIAREGLPSPRK